jgi:hypothetical protein
MCITIENPCVLHLPPWQNTLGVKDMRWNVNVDSRGLEAEGILQSAHSSSFTTKVISLCRASLAKDSMFDTWLYRWGSHV